VVQVCKSDAIDQVPYIDDNATDSRNLDLAMPVMGALGVALDGVSLFGPTDNEARNALVYEGSSLGTCGSHADGQGELHYHAMPGVAPAGCEAGTRELCSDVIPSDATMCNEVTEGPWAFYNTEVQSNSFAFGTAKDQAGSHALLLGFYADGVPLYGPEGVDGQEVSDLDRCGGHSSDLGFYHYHATRTSPYLIACLRGRMQEEHNTGATKWPMSIYKMTDACTAGFDTYDYSLLAADYHYPVRANADKAAAESTWVV
jgi:hypothetical protein